MSKSIKETANEPAASLTYGMSEQLRNGSLLNEILALSHEDKECLVRFIYKTNEVDAEAFADLEDDQQSYTMEELNARIDEAEEEIDRGEGKSFEQMMEGFRKQLLWLK